MLDIVNKFFIAIDCIFSLPQAMLEYISTISTLNKM